MSKRTREYSSGYKRASAPKKGAPEKKVYTNFVKQVARQEGSSRKEESCIRDVVVASPANEDTCALKRTGFVYLLNGMKRGNTVSNRLGNHVRMKSLQFRGEIDWVRTPSHNTSGGLARVSLIYDKRPNGSLPSYEQIYGTVDIDGATVAMTDGKQFAGIIPDNRNRFVVLATWQTFLPAVTTAPAFVGETDLQNLMLDRYIKLQNLPVQFNDGDSGGIGDITEGAIYLTGCSGNDTSVNADAWAWAVRFASRLKFEK